LRKIFVVAARIELTTSDVNLGRNIDVDLHLCLQNDTSMFCETSARNIDASMFSTHSVIFR